MESLTVASTREKGLSPAKTTWSRDWLAYCPALAILGYYVFNEVYCKSIVVYNFFFNPSGSKAYVQGYSSHATYIILFSSNLQLDNGLVGSRLLVLSVPQVDVPSGLVYRGKRTRSAMHKLKRVDKSKDITHS